MFERFHFVHFSPGTWCLCQVGPQGGFSSRGVQTGQGKVEVPKTNQTPPSHLQRPPQPGADQCLDLDVSVGWLKSHHVGQGQKYHLQN
eukprot:s1430_g21.t1